jgi:hypothetical protein
MARHESQREDLLREATALVERVELRLPDQPEAIVAGFRRDGSASFFFGVSPVYQFNSRRELRRGFLSGLLYKAERGRLVEMRRERTAGAVELHSRPLTADENAEFLLTAKNELIHLRETLAARQGKVIGQVPADRDVAGRVLAWLQEPLEEIAVAAGSGVS